MSLRLSMLGLAQSLSVLLVSSLLSEESFQGRITTVQDDQVVVVATASEQRTVKVVADTKITVDGKPARFSELAVGHRVMVVGAKSKQEFTAKTLAAMSPK